MLWCSTNNDWEILLTLCAWDSLNHSTFAAYWYFMNVSSLKTFAVTVLMGGVFLALCLWCHMGFVLLRPELNETVHPCLKDKVHRFAISAGLWYAAPIILLDFLQVLICLMDEIMLKSDIAATVKAPQFLTSSVDLIIKFTKARSDWESKKVASSGEPKPSLFGQQSVVSWMKVEESA